MTDAPQTVSIPDVLGNMASGSPENFGLHFQRLRKMFPNEVAEACVYFIASQELTEAGRSMAFWLSAQGKYVNILFESDSVPADIAYQALAALKAVDENFPIRFLKAAEPISAPRAILRALSLAPALGDYSILIPWLRRLSIHPEARVKSRAVKLLCELRPDKALVERQMQSDDPRVRSNAIEALWHWRTADATEWFKVAASDVNHRVVGSALVGLYMQADPSAFARMVELSESAEPLMRAAMAWCFGFIQDERGIPSLYRLAKDGSVLVRKRALRSLLTLQPNA